MEIAADLTLVAGQQHTEAEPPLRVISAEVWLVNAARQGKHRAYENLYSRYAPMVHGILLTRVPIDDVDDLVQDVFIHALEKLHTLRDPSAFGAWLATITRNQANDFHRRSKNIETVSDHIVEQMPGAADTRTEAVRVLMIIRTLPEAYRETLTLRLVEGMTGPEIAERTGLTPASVRVNLHRGMKMLREKFGLEDDA